MMVMTAALLSLSRGQPPHVRETAFVFVDYGLQSVRVLVMGPPWVVSWRVFTRLRRNELEEAWRDLCVLPVVMYMEDFFLVFFPAPAPLTFFDQVGSFLGRIVRP